MTSGEVAALVFLPLAAGALVGVVVFLVQREITPPANDPVATSSAPESPLHALGAPVRAGAGAISTTAGAAATSQPLYFGTPTSRQ